MQKILCGDIGGTNANFAIAEIGSQIQIKNSRHESTARYNDFSQLIRSYLAENDSEITAGCFAVAGPVKNQRVAMTNANLIIDAAEIVQKTSLKRVLIINDFEAIGFATNVLTDKETKILNKGHTLQKGVKAALGAGTGLGKSILIYNKNVEAYLPYPSEGGHGDLPFTSVEEWDLFQKISQPTYENVLSGKGLEFLYDSIQKKNFPHESPQIKAKEISLGRQSSPCCQETFHMFVKFYARCAKNFTLDLLARGGIYIAGGIAASNPDIFEGHFMQEFTQHALPQFRELLENTPVTLITNYDISLLGAACAFSIMLRQ